MCSAADDPSTYGDPSDSGDLERAVRWYFSASDDLTLAHILDAYARASRADCPYCHESASGVCTLHNGVATPDRADLASEKRDAWRAGWNAARESPPGHTRYIPPSNTIDPIDGGRDDR